MKRHIMVIANVIACTMLESAVPASASTAWQVQTVPKPPDSITRLQGVSCPARGDCIAVGSFFDKATGTEHALAERWNGSGWVIQPTPGLTGQGGFAEVSCLSVTDCTAFETQTGQ